MKKGSRVARIISVMGVETASIQRVAWVKKGKIGLIDDGLEYDKATLREISPAFPGCDSRLVVLEE